MLVKFSGENQPFVAQRLHPSLYATAYILNLMGFLIPIFRIHAKNVNL